MESYADHAFQGEGKAYRRYDTLQALAGTAQGYFAYLSTGDTPAPAQQPPLEALAWSAPYHVKFYVKIFGLF